MHFNFIKKHPDIFTFIGLFVLFYFIFIFGIGSYALMDIDETRYASMAHDMFQSKDFMTLYLNGEYFFEKPPLYFWLECLSFGLFGHVNEFTVRFPVALLGFLTSFLVYYTGKNVVSRKFGLISALILATSAEFFILSKFAILDIVLCFCTTFSIFFGFMTLFCEEKNKKYFWWLFYLFSGLAVLAKGIPGFVLPFGTMFFAYLTAKKVKELFKPIYFIVGTLIFLAIVLPWHLLMLHQHDPLFFNEYIMKHHVARFTTSADLGRKQPFYFFILTILWGFFPWIIPALVTVKDWGSNCVQLIREGFDFNKLNNTQKFITLNAIAAVLTLVFFSASSTKLITYILPIYPFLACLTAKVILDIEQTDKWDNFFTNITTLFGIICVLTGIGVFCSKPFLPEELVQFVEYLYPFSSIFIYFGFVIFLASLIHKYSSTEFKNSLFKTTVAVMLVLSAAGIPIAFNFDYLFGQNDLMEYAKKAKDDNQKLASFGFGRRYSLNYYYGKHVIYEQFPLYDRLNNLLKDKNTVIVIKNKDYDEYKKHAKFDVIMAGIKYDLIKGK
ncbi:MAG: glycosyltransferase family 39 protein [Candidatus Gastranaerophilales bacterium]|nr:glycosyltransferase family 39 protein [Candidatus Gastranaerophilales bacterium]